jgi:hypothetical protein
MSKRARMFAMEIKGQCDGTVMIGVICLFRESGQTKNVVGGGRV